MERFFAWLVRHERFVIIITLALLAILAGQLYFQRPERNLESPSPNMSSNTAANEDSVNETINVSGTWEMAVQKRKEGTLKWTLILEQNGEELKGIVKSEGGDLPVKGTIKGRRINFSARRYGVTVEFPAVLEGEVMNGTMKALTVNRSWTARR